MERIPIEDGSALSDLVVGVYNLVFPEPIAVAEIDLYYRVRTRRGRDRPARTRNEPESVDREVVSRAEARGAPPRVRHIEEGPGERDHGPLFYHRLSELTWLAQDRQADLANVFGTVLDFEAVREHVVESVNEHTVEPDVDSIVDRQDALREAFESADPGA